MSPAFVFIILSQLVMLNSAEKEEEIFRKCPRFNCGNLNRIGFPFTNSRNFSCGFLPVDCLRQRIQLEETGNWYKLFSILPEDTILIQDDELRQKLDKRSCDIFNNISFPDSPSVSFHLAPKSHITLFKCSSHATDPMIDDSFFSRFFTYKECKDFNIYYHKPLSDHRPISRPNCSVITLPVSTTKITGDLFTLLNANISLQVKVSKDCFKCCLRGGQCQEDSKGNFHRANLKGNNRKELKLGLAILCPVIVLGIAFLLIFITCRRHKRFPNFFSKNAYFDPSLRSGLERESVNFGIPFFSYNDLEIATNNFDPSRKLGDGGAGTVYYGKLRDGREVAIKRFYKNNYKRVQQYMNEIKILTLLRHRSLISFYGCTSRTSHELILVYEFVPNGTVADHLHGDRAKPSALTWPLRMNIAIETANALVYLHASNIIHRDVKTKNILLDDNFHVKVADFGLSRLLPIDLTHASTAPQGTPGYVDPEYLQCYQLTDKSDVYSFGVVLIELISSMPAIDIKRHKHEIYLSNYAINKIQNQAINELVDPVLGFQMDFKVRRMTTLVAELAFSCLQSDKEIRPSMNEVLKDLVRIKSEEA